MSFIFILEVFGGYIFLLKGKLYHSLYEENNYLCRCVRVGWGRFRASTRLVKWSHYQAHARADTPGKCRLFKGRKHYTICFLSKNQKDSVNSQKDSVSPRFSEKTQKMHEIHFYIYFLNQFSRKKFLDSKKISFSEPDFHKSTHTLRYTCFYLEN